MLNGIDCIAFGDSLALGTAQAAGIPCNARIGRMPHEIEAAIRSTRTDFVRGRLVVLSSGLSNNPDGRAHVENQIHDLLAAGARKIVLLGLGPGNPKTDLTGANEWLAALAGKHPDLVVFAGSIPNTIMSGPTPGIHCWSYDQLVEQINGLLD